MQAGGKRSLIREQLVHCNATVDEIKYIHNRLFRVTAVVTYKPGTNLFFIRSNTNMHKACRPPLSDPFDMNAGAGTHRARRARQGSLVHLQNITGPLHPSGLRLWSIKSLKFTSGLIFKYKCCIISVGCQCCCAYFLIRTFVHLNFNMAPLILVC